MPFKNTQRRSAIIWLFIGATGLFTTFTPGLLHMDMYQEGTALVFLGIFAAISGIVVSILFFRRSKIIEDTFREMGPIIHWRYEADIWKEYARKEFEYRKEVNKALAILIDSMCLIVGVIFWVIDPDAGKYVFLTMVGIILIIIITAILTAVLPYLHNKNTVGEVYIFHDGLYINGKVHIWKGFTAKLDKVGIDRKGNLLKFVYSAVTRAGRQSYAVLVPIPPGEIKNAENIVSHFN